MNRLVRTGEMRFAQPFRVRHAAGSLVGEAQDFLIRVTDAIETWQERANGRRRLAGLDDRMLRDIGADRGEVAREAAKPFWRP